MFACSLACMSCTHQVMTGSFPPAAQSYAVPAAVQREVRNAADAGDGDIALRTLRQRLAANAKDLDARMLLAQYYSARNLPDLALEHYRLALAQFPDSPAVTLALAKTLREMGEPAEALRTLREYAVREPRGSWEVLSLTGILEDEQGHLSAAEAAHRAALGLEPGKSELHNNLGYNLLSQKQFEPAVNEFRRAIELDPTSQVAHNNLAVALARSGSAPKEALAEWTRSGGAAGAHNNLAAVLMEQGHYAEARLELQTALALQPGMASALANLKLVAEMDGKAATVQTRKRVSIWTKIFGSKPAQPADAAPTDITAPTEKK